MATPSGRHRNLNEGDKTKRKENLEHMKSLAATFKNPQDAFKSVHIAGTNGKGSVSHKVAAALQASGFKVGLFTSPHIETFRERIRVNDEMITEPVVTKYANAIFDVLASGQMPVSFFDIVTMTAFKHFRDQKVDYAVVECGLGGTLDGTNIVQNVACAAVTSIGRDHEDILGPKLKDIAFWKAGIIKPGIGGCVLGPSTKEYKVFHEKFAESGCPKERLKQVKVDEGVGYPEVNNLIAKKVVQIVMS